MWLFFLFGIVLKIYDDAIDLYKTSNTFFLECIKIILVVLGSFIIKEPNPYNSVFLATGVAFSIADWDAYFGDSFFFIISTVCGIYSIYALFIYYNIYQTKEVLLIIFLFLVVNLLEIKYFIPSGIFKKFFTQLLKNDESISEVSEQKLTNRTITLFLLIFMVIYGNKKVMDYCHISTPNVLDTLNNFSMWYIGYYFISCLNQIYVLCIDPSVLPKDPKQDTIKKNYREIRKRRVAAMSQKACSL
ncbi:MAG: hypothetical protein WCJ33_06800 [Pseudomonadota bacterium]